MCNKLINWIEGSIKSNHVRISNRLQNKYITHIRSTRVEPLSDSSVTFDLFFKRKMFWMQKKREMKSIRWLLFSHLCCFGWGAVQNWAEPINGIHIECKTLRISWLCVFFRLLLDAAFGVCIVNVHPLSVKWNKSP